MKICFFDPAPFNYTPRTSERAPLDAPRSALCQLARALALRHEVTLVNRARELDSGGVVRHLNLDGLDTRFWAQQGFDAVIGLDDWPALLALKGLPERTRLIGWQHGLERAEPAGRLAALVCVSHWQRQQLIRAWGATGEKLRVAPAAIGSDFAYPFPEPQSLLHNKVAPLTLACTALPGPGVEMLLRLLPKLRSDFGRLRLWFLPPPQAGPEAQAVLTRLLARAAIANDFEVKGLGGEPDRAQILRQAHVMAYPATVAEADAPAVREALACACRVVCPELGALPETARGWARLVPPREPASSFWLEFIDTLGIELDRWRESTPLARSLMQQSWAINGDTRWTQAVAWWEDLLEELRSESLAGNLAASAKSRLGARLKTRVAEPLRWCFVDAAEIDYQPESPDRIPLGGSQAVLCFLARGLAARGHQVTLINHTRTPGTHAGVKCLNLSQLPQGFWERNAFDLTVGLNQLMPLMTLPGRRVFWNHHNLSVPEVVGLQHVHRELEAIVYVSAWQQAAFQSVFGFKGGYLIPNGLHPIYQSLPQMPKAGSDGALTLAYTSHPSRGLSLLLGIWPRLRQRYPQLGLRIYASLTPYQGSAAQEREFAPLYAQARSLEGVAHLGALPPPELAAALAQTDLLAYPSTYEETFCLSAIEALAAGCRVVSSDLGALSETTAGYAALAPFDSNPAYFAESYLQTLCTAIDTLMREAEPELARSQQQGFIRATYGWQRQLLKWEALAQELMAQD